MADVPPAALADGDRLPPPPRGPPGDPERRGAARAPRPRPAGRPRRPPAPAPAGPPGPRRKTTHPPPRARPPARAPPGARAPRRRAQRGAFPEAMARAREPAGGEFAERRQRGIVGEVVGVDRVRPHPQPARAVAVPMRPLEADDRAGLVGPYRGHPRVGEHA